MRRTWLPKRLLAAVLLSAVGVAFIMASSPAGVSVRQATVLGDGLVALSAVLYSAHILRLSAIVRDRRGETPISPWPLATAKAATQLVCSAAALAIAPPLGRGAQPAVAAAVAAGTRRALHGHGRLQLPDVGAGLLAADRLAVRSPRSSTPRHPPSTP